MKGKMALGKGWEQMMQHSGKSAWSVTVVFLLIGAAGCVEQNAKSPTDTRWREYAKERYETVRQIELANSDVFRLALAMSRDRERLLYSTCLASRKDSPWRTIYLVESASGQELQCLKGHFESTQCLAFARDGRRVVSGGLRIVRLWDIDSGQELAYLPGP